MDFQMIITEHKNKYPLMKSQDFGKLAYQSEFGPKHLGLIYENVVKYLEKEWKNDDLIHNEFYSEYIGNGYVRCYLWKNATQYEKELFAKVFVLTADRSAGTLEGLKNRLEQVKKQDIDDVETWIKEYEKAGYPVLSHTDVYREAYHPHYRLIHRKYVNCFPLLLQIAELLDKKERIIISIDGNCGSGKTTYSDVVKEVFGGNLIHMDDYYLPIDERDKNWRQIPAGNMDLSRFREEVLEPIKNGEDFVYRPYNCQKQECDDATVVQSNQLTIIEGSYSQHPDLADYYDLKVFLTCEKEVQKERLTRREGDYYPMFESCWIPLEECYHEKFDIKEKANLVVDTGNFSY